MYKPGFILFLLILFIYLNSCSPVNYSSLENVKSMEDAPSNKIIILESEKIEEKIIKTKNKPYFDPTLVKGVSIILPINNRYKITEQLVNVIEEDINTVSGVSEYARGQMPEIRRTATEASIIADAGNARAADKLAIVELSIGQIARRVIQLMQQFMTGEQMARIAGKGGEDIFFTYTREDIVGEFDYTVEGGSTQPVNDTIRKQQAVSLLNAMAPLVGTVIDPTALAKHVLTMGFDIKDPDKFIMQQQPMPMGEEEPQQQGQPSNAGIGASQAMMEGLVPQQGGAFGATGGVPPELVAQLRGQMGVELPGL